MEIENNVLQRSMVVIFFSFVITCPLRRNFKCDNWCVAIFTVFLTSKKSGRLMLSDRSTNPFYLGHLKSF